MSWKVVVMLLCVCAWAGLGVYMHSALTTETYRVSEQVVFSSEESYEAFKADFKSFVVTNDAGVMDYSVVASEPPIIVKYSISVPLEVPPPFEDAEDTRGLVQMENIAIPIVMSMITGLIFVLAPAMFLFGSKETKDEISPRM